MEPQVIHETSQYIVINKPSGLVVHRDGKTDEVTLVDWIMKHYPECENVGEDMVIIHKGETITIKRPGIVHRLDRGTSGVMIIARTVEGFKELKEKFQNHEIHKTYHAFVWDRIKEQKGTINQPIGKSRNDFKKWQAGKDARGLMREAITEYEVLGCYENSGITFSDVYFYPKTGRTHQIRVHGVYFNHPMLCDKLYAPRRVCPATLGRIALHAQVISFEFMGENVSYSCDLPPIMSEFLKSSLPKEN